MNAELPRCQGDGRRFEPGIRSYRSESARPVSPFASMNEGLQVGLRYAYRVQHANVAKLALIAEFVHGRRADAELFSHLANRE